MDEPRICSQINLEFENKERKSPAKNFWYKKKNENIHKNLIYIYKLKTSFLKVLKFLIFCVLVGNSL